MKRAVISGATGVVGTALIKVLVSNGVEVLVLCREKSKRNGNILKHPLVEKKYCSLEELKFLKNDTGKKYDVFYHFAWQGTIGTERNDMYLQNANVKYTLDAVEAAKSFGCHTFIGAGSQAEYGRVEGILSSSTPVFPENGYGIAKLCAGHLSRILCEQMGIQHIWARILSIYGPCDSDNSMVMSIIRDLLEKKRPSFTKGEQEWDYLYSMDAGQAMYALGQNGKSGKVYCIGSGMARPLLEYVEIIRDCINPQANLGIGEIPYADKQVMYLCADISELTIDTGFVPKYTFEEGIRETIEWYKNIAHCGDAI